MITRVLAVGLLAGSAGWAVGRRAAGLYDDADHPQGRGVRTRRGCAASQRITAAATGAVSQHRHRCARYPRARGRASCRRDGRRSLVSRRRPRAHALHQHRYHRDGDRLCPHPHRRHARLGRDHRAAERDSVGSSGLCRYRVSARPRPVTRIAGHGSQRSGRPAGVVADHRRSDSRRAMAVSACRPARLAPAGHSTRPSAACCGAHLIT